MDKVYSMEELKAMYPDKYKVKTEDFEQLKEKVAEIEAMTDKLAKYLGFDKVKK